MKNLVVVYKLGEYLLKIKPMELDEETAHTLNWQNRKVLLKKGFFQIDIPFKTNRMYRIYVVYVPNVEKCVKLVFLEIII